MKIPPPIDDYPTDEPQEGLRPISSLIIKSEKAQQQVAPGTWQHSMLRDDLKALYIASALINKDSDKRDGFTLEDLQDALCALASMISKTEKAKAKFSSGTSQYALLRNRLKALRAAEAVITADLKKRNVS